MFGASVQFVAEVCRQHADGPRFISMADPHDVSVENDFYVNLVCALTDIFAPFVCSGAVRLCWLLAPELARPARQRSSGRS
jgi:hypothetical protein